MRDQLPAWSDVRQLAPGMRFEGSFPVSSLPRWPEPEAPGSVRLSVEIVQAASGRLALEASLVADSVTVCQRCMQPLAVQVNGAVALEIVNNEDQARRVPDEVDLYVAEDGRVDWRALACDEALLAWPMMPRHPEGECAPPGESASE